MRWPSLFADLEAQLEAADAAELAGEVAERVRTEQARVSTADRLAAATGCAVTVTVPGVDRLHGRLDDAGPDWLLLSEDGGRSALVPLAAVLAVSGVPRSGPAPDQGPAATQVRRALDLRRALRGLARDRAGVAVWLRDGSALAGTVDRVGADHLDLAEHPPGEARRPGAVRTVRLVPLTAVSVVRSA